METERHWPECLLEKGMIDRWSYRQRQKQDQRDRDKRGGKQRGKKEKQNEMGTEMEREKEALNQIFRGSCGLEIDPPLWGGLLVDTCHASSRFTSFLCFLGLDVPQPTQLPPVDKNSLGSQFVCGHQQCCNKPLTV